MHWAVDVQPTQAVEVRLIEVTMQSTNPFQGENIAYPEDIGSNDQGHYHDFEINEQQMHK